MRTPVFEIVWCTLFVFALGMFVGTRIQDGPKAAAKEDMETGWFAVTGMTNCWLVIEVPSNGPPRFR